MGKNITRRNRKSKKLVKNNRSKKMRGGGDVMPGDRIDFLKNILPNVKQNIKYLEIDLVFCKALHVRFLNKSNDDGGDGLFFFYNYTYKYFSRKVEQAGRIVSRTVNPKNHGTVFGRNLARGLSIASGFLGSDYQGLSETAWIKSDTANFVEEIAKKIGVKVEFKEKTSNPRGAITGARLDDMRNTKYDIFKQNYEGVYFMYSSRFNFSKSNPESTSQRDHEIIYKEESFKLYCIFKFQDLHEIINNFDRIMYETKDNKLPIYKYKNKIYSQSPELRVFQAIFAPNFTELVGIFENESRLNQSKDEAEKQNEERYTIYHPRKNVSDGEISERTISDGAISDRTISENTGEQIMDAIDRNDTIELQKQLSIANDTFNFRDSEGRTPLYFAVKMENLYAIEELIKYPGVDVNLKSNKGFSPLHFAISYGDTEAIKILIQRPDLLIDDEVFNQNKEQNELQRPDEFLEINNILSQKLRPPNTNFERPRSRKNE